MKYNTLMKLFAISISMAPLLSCTNGEDAFSVNTLQLGTGAGTTFEAGDISIADNTLPVAGDSTAIEVHLVDKDGIYATDDVVVTITSACIVSGQSTISPATTTNTNGIITTTYTSNTCSGDDDILVSTDTSPRLTASGTVSTGGTGTTVTPPTAGTSLLFGSGPNTSAFSNGVLDVQNATIDQAGTTTITATVVDSANSYLTSTDALTVNFTSTCVALGQATLSSATASNTAGNPAVYQVTYTHTDNACGSDNITATTTLTGATAQTVATGSISIVAGGGTVTPTTSSLSIGNGIGSGFSSGVNIQNTSLAPLGSTTITANIVDENKLLSTTSNTVNFTANCDNLGNYTINGTASPAIIPVTSSTGVFTATFADVSCDGTVDIIAYATLDGVLKSATGSIAVNDTTTTITQFGRGTLTNFVANQIGIDGDTSNTAALGAGGTATLSVTIVDGSGNLVTDSTVVAFTSDCFSNGLSDIYDAPGGSNSVTTTSGRATATYQAQGCGIVDNVSASSTAGTATGQITVTPANVSSIRFVSATPNLIAIRGMSSSVVGEASTVSFQIKDSSGGAIPAHDVTFSLSNTNGGIIFSDTSAITSTGTSDSNGNISTVVKSGAEKTSFIVIVTSVSDSTIKGQSDPIIVSTGIPDQDSMSLSATVLNPEAYEHDGNTSTITARVSDRFNNPVPDGTLILFSTEGGSIESNCPTVKGACSVTWTGQNPRPTQDYNTDDKGQSTVFAYVVGEESFTDGNGNGVYDSGELFDDKPEAFHDIDGDGVRDDGSAGNPVEPYQDYDNSNTYTGIDSRYNGVLCDGSAACGTATGIHVRDDLVLIMSGSDANIVFTAAPSGTLAQSCTQNFSFTVNDNNGNIMPSGTSIKVTTTGGSITSGSTRTVANSSPTSALGIASATTFYGKLKTGSTDGSGFDILVEVTTPDGTLSEAYSVATYAVLSTSTTCP